MGSYDFLVDATPQDRVFIDAGNASFPMLPQNLSLDPMIGPIPSPAKIMTAQGCLLIPAAFIAWWYWTKHTTRRVVRGVLTFARGKAPASVDRTALGMSADSAFPNPVNLDSSSPSPANTDEFHDPFYGLPEESSSDSSTTFRFIRWLKGTKGSRVRHKVRTATRKNLRDPKPIESVTVGHAMHPEPIVFVDTRQVNSSTYEDIMAVELCPLENSRPLNAPSNVSEKMVRITIETIPFEDIV